MDLLIAFRDFFIHMTYKLPPGLTCYILRMGILLALDAGLLALTLAFLPKWLLSTFLQVCIAFLGLVAALYMPVDMFREISEGFLAFMVALCFLCMIFLPEFLPQLLTKRVGTQILLKKILKDAIWVLFLIQILWGW